MSTTPAKYKSKNKKKNNRVKKNDRPVNLPSHQSGVKSENTVHILPLVIGVSAVYILICFLMNNAEDDVGGLGVFIRNTLYGLFSNTAFLIPFMMGWMALSLKKDLSSGFFKYRLMFSAICLILYSSLIHLFSGSALRLQKNTGFSVLSMFENGKNYIGGGAVGGVIAEVLTKCIGTVGTGILVISLSVVFSIFLFGYTPLDVPEFIKSLIQDYRKNRMHGFARELIIKRKDPNHIFKMKTYKYRISSHISPRADDLDNTAKGEKSNPSAVKFRKKKKIIKAEKNNLDINVPVIINDTEIHDDKSIPIYLTESEANSELEKVVHENIIEPVWAPEKSFFEADSNTNVKEIKTIRIKSEINQSEHNVKREPVFETAKVFEGYKDDICEKEYKLPPLSYLTKDVAKSGTNIAGELNATAARLIETLESFGVKAKVSAVSRGPSVTRYEVSPNAGVKVKSIVNLADDISLSLASGGVRIEAPIPGKAAVGIEVPNRTVSTVYLRTLIEDPKFQQLSGKITVALGMDVAGKPIYSDLSKMPHLLISGATGMGKSVCMNSIITSILYKAKPNEVKLILIDPKKVELTIYNGIPHLLVPVVGDPKKSAGTLNWAVNEMENRFLLIEEKGVRDITAYNDAVAGDPLAEKMPQIVIVIDELADLMMTAPVDVEQSICRLAQKARAAGMHLIIGTQRPSVDVITGLIKANIPSRIAFTVASQIDSRTIIDTKGAEDLIGRGDMLYLPVGASKPMRVQGAYVNEKDVMNVTEFLRKQSDGEYDKQVANEIEIEAQKCSTLKSSQKTLSNS